MTWAKEVQRIKAKYVVIDTAPNDRSLGAACAISDLVLVPCTPSGLDLDATTRTLELVDAVRVPPHGIPRLIRSRTGLTGEHSRVNSWSKNSPPSANTLVRRLAIAASLFALSPPAIQSQRGPARWPTAKSEI